MFANKLIAAKNRYERSKFIAGRDIFDIRSFFLYGAKYKKEIIEKKRQTDILSYIMELRDFIQEKVTQTVIDQDLNMLIPPNAFKKMRTIIKPQTIILLSEEINSLSMSEANAKR